MRLRGQLGIGFKDASEGLRSREPRCSLPLLGGHVHEFPVSFSRVVDIEGVATADLSWLNVQQIRIRLHDRMCLAKLDIFGGGEGAPQTSSSGTSRAVESCCPFSALERHNGLKSDIAPLPKSAAKSRHRPEP